MEDHGAHHFDAHAPQFVDFNETCSPLRIPDFFEKTHEMHERMLHSTFENIENTHVENLVDMSSITSASIKSQADLDLIKSTPVKVISPKNRNNKEVVEETTYEQVLTDAMRKLELCKKPFKTREAFNKTATCTQESVAFKTLNMSKTAKSSRSIGGRSVPNKCVQARQYSMPRSTKISKNICTPSNNTSANTKRTSVNQALFKQDKNCAENDTFKRPNALTDDSEGKEKQINEENKEYNEKNNEEDVKDEKECNETDNKKHNEEDGKELQDESEESTEDNKEIKEKDNQDDVDAAIEHKKDNRMQSSNKHTVLTWCNHRPSLQKRRMSGNKKYISLAEAVSRFQNETPERFRTRSNKANMSMPLNMSKLMQNRLKPTVPISPALVSKNRTRPVTVLSREEREKLEVEEMKKHQIKANPIPPSVLRGLRKTIGVGQKSTTVAHTSPTESNEKACATNLIQPKNPLSHRDKVSSGPKNLVTKVLVTDPEGIIVEREEITFFGVPKDSGVTKNVTRIVPFSFEARNKDLQLKKEQRLKNLQEANKTKPEFHARPVPNFSKPPTPPAKQQQQQQQNKKVLPCPFSFDDRNKKMFEKKEQLVKQVLEEDKRARVFRANPAPTFKPVLVRGTSKDNLLAKDKNTKSERAEDQENREPNVDSSKMKIKNIQTAKNTQKVKKAVCSLLDKAPLKAYPLTLNTDKRAKERHEFDEKMRRKEKEEELKRQEIEKQRLESEKMMQTNLRKLTEVKARPMPAYKAPMVIKATKPLTDPQSPAFASKLRSKQT